MVITCKRANINSVNIFTSPSENNERQFISISFTASNYFNNNFIILPIPNSETLKIYDNSNYNNFFGDCEKMIQLNKNLESYGEMEIGKEYVNSIYDINLVNSIEELIEKKNEIPEILVDYLEDNYSDKGFLIIELEYGKHHYKPLMYSHKISNNKFYLPISTFYQSEKNYMNNITFLPPSINYFSLFPTDISMENSLFDYKIFIANIDKLIGKSKKFTDSFFGKWTQQNHLKYDKINLSLEDFVNFKQLLIKSKSSSNNIDIRGKFLAPIKNKDLKKSKKENFVNDNKPNNNEKQNNENWNYCCIM